MPQDTPQKTKRKEKCILTFARAWNTVAATRCLAKHGVEVITGDDSVIAAGNFSLHSKNVFRYPNPDDHPEKFIDRLVEVCKAQGGDDVDLVLMPMHTCSFVVSEYKDRFEGIAKLALPDIDQIRLVGNKASFSQVCEKYEINTPKTIIIDSPDRLEEIANNFKYPAFLKLPDASAAIGLHKVKNAEETIKHYRHDMKKFNLSEDELPILQEAVEGEDYCSTFLFEHGEYRASMTYHNILDYPPKSGMGALRETVDASEMEAIGAELLRKVGWHGVAEIDFRWDGKHTPYIIEVNPRFWGGLGQSIESGLDYPYLLFRMAVDGHIDPIKAENRQVRTFNPCLMTLLMLREFHDSKDTPHEIAEAFKTFQRQYKISHIKALGRLVEHLGQAVNPVDRFKAVENLLKENKGAVDELFNKNDPLPVLGLLYPLTVFLKKGKISPELLVSKAGKK